MGTPESEFYNWFSSSRARAKQEAGRYTAKGLRQNTLKKYRSERAASENRVKQDMDTQEYLKGYREIRSSLTGDVYKMPQHDYKQLVKHFNEHVSQISQTYADSNQVSSKIQTPADLIDYAFEKKSQQKNLEIQECAEGHIKSVSYNPVYMLLKVSFRKRGDEVVFFDLPPNVAATLLIHARDGNMGTSPVDGKPRHMVGIEFWNLVRVRGTQHETRYPFQYTVDNRTGSWNGDNRTYSAEYGRRPGSGATGRGQNKYSYVDSLGLEDMGEEDPYDMRRKNISEEKRSEYPVKERRYEWDEYTRMFNKANRGDLGNWDIDDAYEYFDEKHGKYRNMFNSHMAMAQGDLRKDLLKAEDLYNKAPRYVYVKGVKGSWDLKGEHDFESSDITDFSYAKKGEYSVPIDPMYVITALLAKTGFKFPKHDDSDGE